LNTLPKNPEIKFDAINISRIVKNKKQHLFVRAAKKLGLRKLEKLFQSNLISGNPEIGLLNVMMI